jgi:hypothetical protein
LPAVATAAIAQELPLLAALLARVRSEVRFDLRPDMARFPRAFTIDDAGDGHPLVSCPCTGRTSDLLLLAHEIGHALQALTRPVSPLPPIQREIAAFIVEEAAERRLRATYPATGPILAARQARVTRHGPDLSAALNAPQTRYHYAWNYPVARAIAAYAAITLPSEELANLVIAPGALAPILARLGPAV